MVTQKGLEKDEELAGKIDKAVFPAGIQAGPHNHQTAAIAVALKEAMTPEFALYGKQVVSNAKTLAEELTKRGMKLVSGGTENHLMILDLTEYGKGHGIFLDRALEKIGITANKNTIPKDPSSPFYPSGLRLGTPAITTRGMKESEMKEIAEWITRVLHIVKDYRLPGTKEERIAYLRQFKKDISESQELKNIKQEVKKLCSKFPLPY